MIKFFTFILTFFSILTITSQNKKFADKSFYLVDSLVLEDLPERNVFIIDSCLALYHKTDNDSLKWNYLNIIIENTYSEAWYKFQKVATQITNDKLKQKLTKVEKETFLLFNSSNLNNEAYWLTEKGHLNEAVKIYEKAVENQKKIKIDSDLALMLANLGNNYNKQGKIEKAISLYEESVLIAKKVKSKSTGYIIANLAMIYNNSNRIDEALNFLNEALKYDEVSSNDLQKAKIYSDQAVIFKKKLKNYQKALFYHNKSLSIHQKITNEKGIASELSNIGKIHLESNNPDTLKALEYIRKSLNINLKINYVNGISSDFEKLSELYFSQLKKDSALIFGIKAYNFALNSENPTRIKDASKILSKIYNFNKDYKNAFFYYKEAEKMTDSLKNKENTFALAKTEAKLQYENEKELENIKHRSELKLKEKEKEKQALYKQFFIIGSLLLAIILGFIARQLYKSTKQKKEIEETNLKLEEQHNEITSSIVYAQRIQNAILPLVGELQETFSNSFVAYQPKDIVSGDFYWIEESKNKIHLAVADCTGHGVPGAMVSVICNNALNRSVREFKLRKTNEILNKAREIVIQEFEKSGEDIKDGMDVSLISIDFESKKLEFSGANNPVWIVRKQENKLELIELKGDKQPIGNYVNAFPFTTKDFDLIEGDSIYLSSDGYADQFGGEKNKKIKTANFKKLLISLNHLDMNIQQEKLQDFFDNWKGENEQLDDVCVVGIKI